MKFKIPVPKVNKEKLSSLKGFRVNWLSVWIKFLSFLSYFGILILLPLFFKRKNQFVAYHLKQGTVFLYAWVAFLFSFYLPFLPIIIGAYIVVCLLLSLINIAQEKEKPLILIGKYANKFV